MTTAPPPFPEEPNDPARRNPPPIDLPYGHNYSPYSSYPPYPPKKNHGWVKWLVISIIVVIIFVVVGCIGLVKLNNVTTYNHTPLSPTTTENTHFTHTEIQYLAYIHKDTMFHNVSDTDTVTVGHEIYGSFQNGDSYTSVTDILSSAGVPAKQSTELITGAVTYLCPDQQAKLPVR